MLHHQIRQLWQQSLEKKFATILLATCLFVLAACGSSESNPGIDLGNGSLLAFIGTDGNVWLAQANGQNAHAITTTTCPVTASCFSAPIWSPDGQHLAFFGPTQKSGDTGNVIYRYNRKGLLEKTVAQADKLAFGTLLWSPDGTSLAYLGRDTSSSVKPAPPAVLLINSDTGNISGKVLIPAPKNSDVACPDNPPGGPLGSFVDRAIQGSNGLRYTFDISKDGSHYLVSSGACSTTVSLVQTDGTAKTLTALNDNAAVTQAAFSPDGQHIVAMQSLQANAQLLIYDGTGSNARSIFTDDSILNPVDARISSPVWSIDSKEIIFMRGASLWAVNADASNAHQLLGGTTDTTAQATVYAAPVISPDGQHLAWIELTFSASENIPRSIVTVGNIDAKQPQTISQSAVWAAWSK